MTSISRRNFTQLMLAAAATGIAGLPNVAWAQEDGDTLRIAILKATGNLDPHIYRAIWGVQSVIYDPLVKYVEGGTIEPGLAESWTVSDDGKSYMFKLREGAVFHDGTPADASAIEWNFKRWIGMDDHSWLVTSANYDSMAVVDALTFQLNLKKPIPQVLSELSLVRPVRFLSPASVDADGKYVNPIGTGPWKVVVSDETHTLVERNEQFWGEKPAFSKIDFLVIPDGNSRSAALRAGEIDIAGGDYVSPVTPEQALVLKSSGVGVVTETGTNTFLLGYNQARAILQDVKVRQAISLGIDRAAIATAVYSDFTSPTGSLVPQTVPMAGKPVEVPIRDVDKAKALLEEAGWTGDGVRSKDGQPLALELVLSEEAVQGSRAVGEVVQAQLAEVGFDITLRSLDHATRHGDIPQGLYDLTFFFTIGAPYDPHSTLTNYFLSTFPNGADGKMWTSADLDPLLLDAIETGGPDQAAKYQLVYDWIYANQAVAPLFHPQRIWVHTSRVNGFAMPPTEYDMPYEGITLS
ncbi:MAG: ABC transporter substrate-binding protein [Devosia sp.]